jgi:hypothetical protein
MWTFAYLHLVGFNFLTVVRLTLVERTTESRDLSCDLYGQRV